MCIQIANFLSIWFFIIKEQYYSTIGYSWSPSSMSTALLLSPLTVSQFIFDKLNCIIFMKWEKYRMRHCTCRTIFYNLHMQSTTCQHRDHVHAQWTRTIRWDSRRSGRSSWCLYWHIERICKCLLCLSVHKIISNLKIISPRFSAWDGLG